MKRYLDDQYINRFIEDFKFLFTIINKSCGEYDLRLRDNYFNLYYQGNSLAKIIFGPGDYKISIHNKFVTEANDQPIYFSDERFDPPQSQGEYLVYSIEKKLLHPFFQVTYLKKMASRIIKVNNGEEIGFEQMLITDNLNREEFIIIDRQVMDKGLKRRMDLLALKHIKDDQYQFVVLEVKLGKNPELKSKVVGQLKSYVDHINNNLGSWKKSYEKTYQQIKMTGIYNKPAHDKIKIVGKAQGRVVVGGYSGIAATYLDKLKTDHTSIEVKQFKYVL